MRQAIPGLSTFHDDEPGYFGIDCAPDVLRWLTSNGWEVAGMEGFTDEGDSFRASLEHIAVFDTSSADRAATIDWAIGLLDEWRDEIDLIDFSSWRPRPRRDSR